MSILLFRENQAQTGVEEDISPSKDAHTNCSGVHYLIKFLAFVGQLITAAALSRLVIMKCICGFRYYVGFGTSFIMEVTMLVREMDTYLK
ncbi:hypothetical protein CEXT_447361 [Caerostris extrusa]|uniref:Uncharacterized protein n=1 Tax=Caerostris extrusa TaxID=172846 RepID=A0AAV4VM84_CAEEX|nr:hypothetical protein CEXT_447361 [Caerostris extrusa]